MARQWMLAPLMQGCAEFARRLNVHPLIAQILHNRGVTDTSAARDFLNPELIRLHPPEQLAGIAEAAALLAEKVRQKKTIAIYGDYDVDGITATAILWQLLKLAKAQVSYYIPHRLEEGYGLNADALRQLRASGVDTVVTVDCGATACAEARLARELGLTLIVTDHHAPGDELPCAEAVVHPALEDYPNPALCGAGVAFKLAWAVAQQLSNSERVTPEFREFLISATGLAALGTIADVSPLIGENRILARFGLHGLSESKLVGLRALLESARLTDCRLNSEHAGFWLAPRLNAAGRMGHAELAVELFTSADENRAREIALYLEDQNRRRQKIEKQIFKEACERIDSGNLASDAARGIVLADADWHAGVIGIVASRIVDRYCRPTIMIALNNGEGQGSGRSVRHFELHKALAACSEHLLTYGGHAMAAGLRIRAEQVEAFRQAFIAQANQTLTGKDLQPTLRLDAEIPLGLLSEPLIRQIEQLGPFGASNPKPCFASGLLALEGEPRLMGRLGEHMSFNVTDGQNRLRAVAFKGKDGYQPLMDHRRCRLAYVPTLNTYNGRTTVELQILDMVFPES
ncbi:MAG: single-stranded-DNA-specific exonuclease RecJ [Phycisphaerales bacterium]|nr:single-stranded-DNA-specific exonuclease RecJ [Phycisphaerales bacterium]